MFNLFAHKSVLANITLGPIKVKGMSESDANRLARDLLERVGIPEKADDFGRPVGRQAAARRDRPCSRWSRS